MAGNASAGNSPSKASATGAGALGYPSLQPLGQHSKVAPIPLMRPVTLVGSRQNAHLHLLSRQVSKAHALIINSDSKVYVRDLASRTHIYVNGEEVREADLQDGDLLKIGSFTFKYQAAAGMKQRAKPDETPPGQLEVEGGELPLPVDQRVLLIGRRPTCDISLVEESVSTGHAVLFSMGAKRYIRDLGSRTGTFINGRKEKQAEVKFGDVIKVGETSLRYEAAGAGMEAAPIEVDEFEDLVGTAPLVDSSLGTEAPAPLPQSFDSSSAQGRAGRAVAADPLGVNALDLDMELDAPKKSDTAMLPAIEVEAPKPPHKAATPVALVPPPIEIDEQRLLVGDNLLREKLSSSGTGAGMQSAAREALELAKPAAEVRRPSAPVKPPIAPPPSVAPATESAPIPIHFDDPIPLAFDEPVSSVEVESGTPVVDEPVFESVEDDSIPFDAPLETTEGEFASQAPVAEAPTGKPPITESPKDSGRRRGWFGWGRRQESVEKPGSAKGETTTPAPDSPVAPIELEPLATEIEPSALDEMAADAGHSHPSDEARSQDPGSHDFADNLAPDDQTFELEASPSFPTTSSNEATFEPSALRETHPVQPPEAELQLDDLFVDDELAMEPAVDEHQPAPVASTPETWTPLVPSIAHEPGSVEHALSEEELLADLTGSRAAEQAFTEEELDLAPFEVTAPIAQAAPREPAVAEPERGLEAPVETHPHDTYQPPEFEGLVGEDLANLDVNAVDSHAMNEGDLDALMLAPDEHAIEQHVIEPHEGVPHIEGSDVEASHTESEHADTLHVEPALDASIGIEVAPVPAIEASSLGAVAPSDELLGLAKFDLDFVDGVDASVVPPAEIAVHPTGSTHSTEPVSATPEPVATSEEHFEVIEPVEPSLESALSVGESLGMPIDEAPSVQSATPHDPIDALSDSTFGSQVGDFIGESPEPIVVETPHANETTHTSEAPSEATTVAGVSGPLIEITPVESSTQSFASAGAHELSETAIFADMLGFAPVEDEQRNITPLGEHPVVEFSPIPEVPAEEAPAVEPFTFELPAAEASAFEAPVFEHGHTAVELPPVVDVSVIESPLAVDQPVNDELPLADEEAIELEQPVALEQSTSDELTLADEASMSVDLHIAPVGHEEQIAVNLPASDEPPFAEELPTHVEPQPATVDHEKPGVLDPSGRIELNLADESSAIAHQPVAPEPHDHLSAIELADPLPLPEVHPLEVHPPAALESGELLAGAEFQRVDHTVSDDFLYPLDEEPPSLLTPTEPAYEPVASVVEEPLITDTLAHETPLHETLHHEPPAHEQSVIEAAITEAAVVEPPVSELHIVQPPAEAPVETPLELPVEHLIAEVPVSEHSVGDMTAEAQSAETLPTGEPTTEIPVADVFTNEPYAVGTLDTAVAEVHAPIEETPFVESAAQDESHSVWDDGLSPVDEAAVTEELIPSESASEPVADFARHDPVVAEPDAPSLISHESTVETTADGFTEESYITEDVIEEADPVSSITQPPILEETNVVASEFVSESVFEPVSEVAAEDVFEDDLVLHDEQPHASVDTPVVQEVPEQVDSISELERIDGLEVDQAATVEETPVVADSSHPIETQSAYGHGFIEEVIFDDFFEETSTAPSAPPAKGDALDPVDTNTGTEPSSTKDLSPREVSPRDLSPTIPPFDRGPTAGTTVLPPASGSAELTPQQPLAGLGFFDLGTDQASFLGGLPLNLNEPQVTPPPVTPSYDRPSTRPPASPPSPFAQQAISAPAEDAPGLTQPEDADSLDVVVPPVEESAEPPAPRKTMLSQPRIQTPGRRPARGGSESDSAFGAQSRSGGSATPPPGFGAPAQIFGGLSVPGGNVDVFSQGMSADLSNDPVFGNTVKETASKRKKKPAESASAPVAPSTGISTPVAGAFGAAAVGAIAADELLQPAVADARKPVAGRRSKGTPESVPPPAEVAEESLSFEQGEGSVDPVMGSPETEESLEFSPVDDFTAEQASMPADEPALSQEHEVESATRSRTARSPGDHLPMSVPTAHRHRGRGIAVLLVLMLLLMAGSFAAIYTFLKQRYSTTATMTYQNVGKLQDKALRELQNQQVAKLAQPAVQELAKRILHKNYPTLEYGFLDNVPEFAKNDSPQRAKWSDTNPGELKFSYEGQDPIGDKARVEAVMTALYTLDTKLREEAQAAAGVRDRIEHELDRQSQKVEEIKTQRAALTAARDAGVDEIAIKNLEADVAEAQKQHRAAWDAFATAEAELKQIESPRIMPTTNTSAGTAAPVAVVDPDLEALQKAMEAASNRLENARKTAAEQAELSRKSLDGAIEQFQQSMNTVQGMMKDSPELSQYVTAAQRLLETTHKLSGDLLDRQQVTYDHLVEMKKTIDAQIKLRKEDLYAADKMIKQLKDEMAMHERGLNAAIGQNMDAEALTIRKEIDDLFAKVSKRKLEIDGESALRTLNGVSELLSGEIQTCRTQLEADRKQTEAMLTQLEGNLKNSAEVEKLPDAQKALAGQLAARIEALNSARKGYGDAMEARSTEANAGLKFLEEQVRELSVKMEQRRTLVQAHEQNQMTAEQKERHDAEVTAKRAALDVTLKARAAAETASFKKSNALNAAKKAYAEARAAEEILQAKNTEWEMLRKAVAQKTDQLKNTPAAGPYPDLPVVGEPVKLPDDVRPRYTAISWGGIALVFSGLILMVALRADKPQAIMPMGPAHTYSNEHQSALA